MTTQSEYDAGLKNMHVEAKAEAESNFRLARLNLRLNVAGAHSLYKSTLAKYRSYWNVLEWVWYTLVGVPSTGKWFTLKYAWRRIVFWATMMGVVCFHKEIAAAIF